MNDAVLGGVGDGDEEGGEGELLLLLLEADDDSPLLVGSAL